MPPNVPTNDSVVPPIKIKAGCIGNQVTISWTPPPDAVGQGFLLELGICNGGFLLNVAYKTEVILINITDDENCSGDSFGTVRTFNKLGYSEEVIIPWPNE